MIILSSLSLLANLCSTHLFAFLSPSYGEMIVVGVVALLLFGSDLPNVARSWGKTFSEFRRSLSGIQNDLNDVMYSEPERLEYHHDHHYNQTYHHDSNDHNPDGTPLVDAREAGLDLEGQAHSTSATADAEVANQDTCDSQDPHAENPIADLNHSESLHTENSDNETSESELSNLVAPDSTESSDPQQERPNTNG